MYLSWVIDDVGAGTLTVSGNVARVKGQGLRRFGEPKSDAGLRTNPLPRFAIEAINARRSRPFVGQQQTIVASAAGSLRDPEQLRQAVAHPAMLAGALSTNPVRDVSASAPT